MRAKLLSLRDRSGDPLSDEAVKALRALRIIEEWVDAAEDRFQRNDDELLVAEQRVRDQVLPPGEMTNDELLAEARHLRDIHPSLRDPLGREAVASRNALLVAELRGRGDRRA